jgi:RNA polymerase sigma factor (sigma-70 family)
LSALPLYNEALLIEQFQAGCQQAFTALYRHYSPRIYLNILRMVHDPVTAEEMVQELFTRVWQNRENKGLQENFTAYIYRIAQNLVFDFFRKAKRDHKLMEKFRSVAEQHYEHIEEELQNQQSTVILEKAIAQLSPQQKKVYNLVKIEGCTYKKAAEIMGISPFTVKEYLVSTNKSIRKYVVGQMDKVVTLLIFIDVFSIHY